MPENREVKTQVAKKRRRRIKRSAQRVLVLFVAVLVILGIAALITHLIQRATGADDSVSVPTTPVAPPQAAQSESEVAMSGPDRSGWNFIGPVEQTINDMTIITPDYRMIALPENGRVDISYFDTVTFVGDSITQGINMYPQYGIMNAHYCAYKSINIRGVYDGTVHTRADGEKEVPMEALAASQPDNVYVMLGTNDMVTIADDAILLAYYKEMLDAMRATLHPSVHIYVQSITPIRPEAAKSNLSNERIVQFNSLLAQLAWEQGVYYLDLHEALAGDDGYLRADFAGSDGIHMKPEGYAAWRQYLVTHTAYSPNNPYLEGSDYYSQEPVPEE